MKAPSHREDIWEIQNEDFLRTLESSNGKPPPSEEEVQKIIKGGLNLHKILYDDDDDE